MKEIIQSKLMVAFMVMVLGIIYINSASTSSLEISNNDEGNQLVTANIK